MQRLVFIFSLILYSRALPSLTVQPTEPDPSFFKPVDASGVTFVNKGMVAFGLISSNFTESTGDTLGGIGSAIAIKRNTFSQNSDGTFSGTLVVQPDRGFNIDGTIDYQGRQHDIDFVLSPYYGDADLSFSDAQKTLALNYRSTLLYTDESLVKTSGLDALAVRPAGAGFPQLPIPSKTFNHLTLDCEGLVLNADGSFWMSDEYGPYVYKFSSSGQLLQTIQPPEAILPFINGDLNFTSDTDPDTGRAGNQGFEGLTADFRSWVQFLPWSSFSQRKGESVAPIRGGATLSPFCFLLRDGDGNGGSDTTSSYKQADLIDISSATDIHGSKFDEPTNPIAKKGTLDKSITPAVYTSFLSFIDSTQLARFGLHNGDPLDETLIDSKWESLALAPCGDESFPDDYFLFTASDNDFLSTQGRFDGTSFNAGQDVDNQFMVFRVTLPTVERGSVEQSIGI